MWPIEFLGGPRVLSGVSSNKTTGIVLGNPCLENLLEIYIQGGLNPKGSKLGGMVFFVWGKIKRGFLRNSQFVSKIAFCKIVIGAFFLQTLL